MFCPKKTAKAALLYLEDNECATRTFAIISLLRRKTFRGLSFQVRPGATSGDINTLMGGM